MIEKQEKIKLAKPKIERKVFIKSVVFFSILSIVLMAAVWLKFHFSPNLNIVQHTSAFVLSLVSIVLIISALQFYLLYTRREIVNHGRDLYVIGTVVALSYIVNIYFSFINVFAIPTTLAAFILAPLLRRRRDVFIGNIFCNLLIVSTLLIESAFSGAGGLDLSVMKVLDIVAMFNLGIVGGTVVAYVVSSRPGRSRYILKSLCIAAFFFVAILGYAWILSISTGYSSIAGSSANAFYDKLFRQGIIFALIAAFAPLAMALLLTPLIELGFNLLTDARLVDLTDHNAPLLARLRIETPGTFSHSLAVASFAEMCASAIGENPYLARAAAFYHDVGKLENPRYYKENQGETNYHDELLPEVSAEIIRQHTEDGLALCQKHRIPIEISHVTVQHHGTLLIPVFFEKARKLTDSTVEPQAYSYHGVTPRSKIAAIIMLCDAGEAAIRAMDKPDGDKVNTLLSNLISERIAAKQFDQCDISLKDLTLIKNTIINAYGGLYHTRLQYPDGTAKG